MLSRLVVILPHNLIIPTLRLHVSNARGQGHHQGDLDTSGVKIRYSEYINMLFGARDRLMPVGLTYLFSTNPSTREVCQQSEA